MATQTQLSWQTVDMTTLPPHVRDAFAKISTAKAEFEAIFSKALHDAGAVPPGLEPKFSDKWGKLSIAFAKASANPGAASGPFRLTPTASQAAAPMGETKAPAQAPTPQGQGGKVHK